MLRSAHLELGDTVALGPYEIVVVEPPEGVDHAITLEFVRPLGDELEQLRARSSTTLAHHGLSKRGWSWGLFVGVIVLFLAVPVIVFFVPAFHTATVEANTAPDKMWLSGEISPPHKFFGENCTACHEKAFVSVRDAACLECHAATEAHADRQQVRVAALEEARCASCHKEHGGSEQIVLREQVFCSSCHEALGALGRATTLLDVADFGTDHPEFRPSVMIDGAAGKIARVSWSRPDQLKESSNLKFPHASHLKKQGIRGPKGLEVLTCAACHRTEPGGAGMVRIDMEADCQACHKLTFDKLAKGREIPHGDIAESLDFLAYYSAGAALRGGVEDAQAPQAVRDRRRPGTVLSEAVRLEALAWAEARASEVTDMVIGKTLCATCHVVDRASGGRWTVAPVRVAKVWLPKARFHHESHSSTACADCHRAEASKDSEDVLLTGIAKCRECHGGEDATAKLPSTCIMCHVFHRPELGPMRHGDLAAAGK